MPETSPAIIIDPVLDGLLVVDLVVVTCWNKGVVVEISSTNPESLFYESLYRSII